MITNFTNEVSINTAEEFIASAKEAKKFNIQRVWTMDIELLKEIILSDDLDELKDN